MPLGEPADTAARCCCESKDGKSVDELLNACENQPESLLGSSARRVEEEEELG